MHYRALTASALILTALPVWAQDADEHHQVEEVVVSAVPIERTVEQLAQPTGVVDGATLARRQGASIGEAVADEPGVSATYFGPIASRPVVRGQYGERVTVLSNGLDSLDASALSEDHAVSADTILSERIEIVRGPATLLYGSGAAGGLVNVIDSRIHEAPPEPERGGALAVGFDSASEKRFGAIKLHVGNDRVVGHFDGFRRATGDVSIPGFAESARLRASDEHTGGAYGRIDNSASETTSAAAALSLLADHGFAGLSLHRYETNYGVPGHAHEEHDEEEDALADEDEEDITIDLEQTRADLHAALDLDQVFERIDLRLARNAYEHVEFEGTEVGTVYENDGLDMRLGLRQRPFGDLQGSVGVQFKSVELDARGEEAFVPSSRTRQLSVFAFEELAVGQAWVVQGSARLERQEIETPVAGSEDETALGAALGAIWTVGDGLTLAVNAALTERNPNATELYALGPHVAVQRFERGAIARGDGALTKERSGNIDFTLRGKHERVEWSATLFRNRVDDYILLAPTSLVEDGLPVFDYVQRDAELYGFEAELTYDLLDTATNHLHARVFSDYVHGEQRASGDYLPRLPPLRVGFGVHYTRGALDTAFRLTRHARQEKTASFELPTDAYTMLDVEVSHRFDAGVLAYLRGTNLLDDDARRHASPLKEIAPLPGVSLAAGLRWNF